MDDKFNKLIVENASLRINYRVILNNATITCETNSITGLLGRNGAGKSMLLKVIFGIQNADNIAIGLNGKQLSSKLYKINDLVSFLPQYNFIPSSFKLCKVAYLFDVDVVEIFKWFPEFKPIINCKIDEISTGFARLFSIMLLILSKDKFCLLDEPFTYLSPVFRQRLVELIRHKKCDKGIICTDHDYRSVLEVSDKICFLKDGSSYPIKDVDDLIFHNYLLD